MIKFTFEADILVPTWERKRKFITVDKCTTQALLDKLPVEDNPLSVTVDDLHDLLNNTGEISSRVALSNSQEQVQQLLHKLTVIAWKSEIPWEVHEHEIAKKGDEEFESFVRAFTSPPNGYYSAEMTGSLQDNDGRAA